jgi:hypothetical protein
MPYLFPNEDTFVIIISLVIGAVLLFRWYVVQDRKK